MESISQVSLRLGKEDLRVWNDPPSHTFSVKSAYNKLVNHRSGGRGGTSGAILGDTLCVLCGREEESTSHILVSSKVSIKVWNMCFSWIGISSVNHNDLIHHFEQFSCICFNQEGNKLWKSLWVSVVWCIWKFRNKVTFNHAKEIFTMAQVQSWVWMKHKVRKVKFFFSDWMLFPLTCINMATK